MSYANLRNLLIKHEGVRLQVYDDATGKPLKPGDTLIGHPTIGIGRCLDKNGITQFEAYAMLAEDIERVMRQCHEFPFFKWIGPARQDCVASLIFQLGLTGFKGFRKMIAALEAQNYAKAADELLDSTYARQVPIRAQELAQMMRSGAYPTGT